METKTKVKAWRHIRILFYTMNGWYFNKKIIYMYSPIYSNKLTNVYVLTYQCVRFNLPMCTFYLTNVYVLTYQCVRFNLPMCTF